MMTALADLGFIAPFLAFAFGAVETFDLEVTGAGGFLGEGGAEAAWHLEFDGVDWLPINSVSLR